MAVIGTFTYQKEYKSSWKSVEDRATHGSDHYIPKTTLATEDKKLQEKIKENYAHSKNYQQNEHEGFDGNYQYNFWFSNDIKITEGEKAKTPIKYNSTVEVRRSGNKERIKKECDLELFLLKEGFKKI